MTKRYFAFRLMLCCGAIVLLCGLFAAAFGEGLPTADEVLDLLTKGNERYAHEKSTYPHSNSARRDEVFSGQHPLATIISCSDSRVPPELLFDQGIGDLFIIRVIGNIGGADETGSAEYGVEHLGTPLLIVEGHTSCGAVNAAVTHAEVHGSIPPLLAHIKPAILTAQREHPNLHGADLVPEAIKANVFHSIEELFKRSEIIRSRTRLGKLKVVGAIYDIKSGQVAWLGNHPRQSALLSHKEHHKPVRQSSAKH